MVLGGCRSFLLLVTTHPMVDRRHSIFIVPLFLGFHRHDVINKYVSKEKVSRQICAP